MRHLLLAALLFVAPLLQAQRGVNNQFFVRDADTLVAAALDVTVQQPATGSRLVVFDFAEVYCSAACVVSISRDGTAASTTAATEVSLNGGLTATATAFYDSNAGAGTAIKTLNLSAGQTATIDLDGFILEPDNSTANNLTIQTDAISGTAYIYIRWQE